jgi:hypothetical protein
MGTTIIMSKWVLKTCCAIVAPTWSNENGIQENKPLQPSETKLLKALYVQVEFWKPYNCTSLIWTFFFMNDDRFVNIITT